MVRKPRQHTLQSAQSSWPQGEAEASERREFLTAPRVEHRAPRIECSFELGRITDAHDALDLPTRFVRRSGRMLWVPLVVTPAFMELGSDGHFLVASDWQLDKTNSVRCSGEQPRGN